MEDALKLLDGLREAMKFRLAVSSLCCGVRRIDETDECTLRRLIDERYALLRLLDELKIRARDFDHSFKEWPGPVAPLRKHLGLPEESGAEFDPRRFDDANRDELQHAERMTVLWAQRAEELRKQQTAAMPK